MSSQKTHQELDSGINALGLDCSSQQTEQLIAYLEMLQRWNKAYNLTAIREPIQMVRLHLLDSLAIHPYILGVKILSMLVPVQSSGNTLGYLKSRYKFHAFG